MNLPQSPGGVTIAACTAQHQGDRPDQQDRVAVLRGDLAPRCALGVLADGLGGSSGGAIAAENAILATQSRFDRFSPRTDDPADFFRELVAEVHTVIRLTAITAGLEPHSTFAAVLLQPDRVDWCHVGDSRIYHFRDGEMRHCTRDHTLAQKLVSEGRLPPERAHLHPSAHRLVHALGTARDPVPDIGSLAAPRSGDAFLLCSDGLWAHVPPAELGELIARRNVRDAAATMIERARERAHGHGDNCSLVLMKYQSV